MEPTDIVLIGPGAIGCAFAAALVEVGHRVTLAGRTPVDRLDVRHPAGRITADVSFVDSPTHLRRAPIVLLATKAYQVPNAAALIVAACGPGTVLAILQNGIDHRARVAGIVEAGVDVLPTMVACPADRIRPGHVEVRGGALLEVPDTPGGARFAQAFDGSFATVRTVPDIHTSLWRKLLLNAVGGGIGVIARRNNSLFVEDDAALALARGLATEVLAVARADGADLDVQAIDSLIAMLGRGSAHFPSIVVDRIGGQRTEWEIRNEVVVRKADAYGVAAPLNRMLSTLIRLGEPPAVPPDASTYVPST